MSSQEEVLFHESVLRSGGGMSPSGWIGGRSREATDAASLAASGRGQQLAAEGGPPQLSTFFSSPRPAGRQLPPPSARALPALLCLQRPLAARLQKFDHLSLPAFSCFFLFGGSRKRARQGRARLRQSWDHGPGAGDRRAGAVLSVCSGAPGRRTGLGVRRQRALSRPGAARRGAGGPMGRAHTCPPGSAA